MKAEDAKKALQKEATSERALLMQRYFKTGVGQYGEGDVFIGVSMPAARKICRQFADLPLPEVQKLLDSKVHEHRMVAVIILANQYPTAGNVQEQKIYELYLKNVYGGRINNWDLVDVSTPQVVGAHLESRTRDVLVKLARSEDIWQKRVAMLATAWFITKGDAATTIKIAQILLHDKHDLIHKAVGWMLREAGKRVDEEILTDFLDNHAHEMPRTMLRYSIERLSPKQRTHYMQLR